MKYKLTQPWLLRKALYIVTSITMLALVVFGVLSEGQADIMSEKVSTTLIPLIMMGITGLAAKNTNPEDVVKIKVEDSEEILNLIQKEAINALTTLHPSPTETYGAEVAPNYEQAYELEDIDRGADNNESISAGDRSDLIPKE